MDDDDLVDFFDEDSEKTFVDTIDNYGIAISAVKQGVVVGLTKEKLLYLLDMIEYNNAPEDNEVVVVLIRKAEDAKDILKN